MLSATSYAFSHLETGFLLLVDVTSKIATVGTFIWAVLTLSQQRISAREAEAEKIEEKIVSFISKADFKLRRASARVLIYYLNLMKSYKETRTSKSVRPIIEEYLSALKISDLLDSEDEIEEYGSYTENIEGLKALYENLKFNPKIDTKLARRVSAGLNICINPPGYSLDFWQIIDLLTFVSNINVVDLPSLLESEPSELTDPHHRFHALFAYYFFYKKSFNLSVKIDGSLLVSELILDQPRSR